MWYCNECERQYETPKVGREFVGEIGHGGNVEYPICPTCKGGGDIEELKDCPMCKENYITSGKDRCAKCEERTALWLEEAIGNIQSDTGAERSEVLRAMVDWIEKL
jgi:RecJ-like exonuclease